MRTFTVLVHVAEEGGYWAEVPELPGCASQGETLDELRTNVLEADCGLPGGPLGGRGGNTFPERVEKWEIPFPVDQPELAPA